MRFVAAFFGFLAAFVWVGIWPRLKNAAINMSNLLLLLFFKDVLQLRLENAAIGTPKAALYKNMATVLSVAMRFKRGYRLNKIKF